MTIIKRAEIALTPAFLQQRNLTLASLFNPFRIQETLHAIFDQIPQELWPINGIARVERKDDSQYCLTYDLEKVQLQQDDSVELRQISERELDCSDESDIEGTLDDMMYMVSDSRFCRRVTLQFTDTPAGFVREYLEQADCDFAVRQLNPYQIEVTIGAKRD